MLYDRQHELIRQLDGGLYLNCIIPAERERPVQYGETSFCPVSVERELERINEALHAMNEGTYGYCSVCSIPIELNALLVSPETDCCELHV